MSRSFIMRAWDSVRTGSVCHQAVRKHRKGAVAKDELCGEKRYQRVL